jgi:hypothetical protein
LDSQSHEKLHPQQERFFSAIGGLLQIPLHRIQSLLQLSSIGPPRRSKARLAATAAFQELLRQFAYDRTGI